MIKNKNIVFLTGAGISKESGINTFRDSEDGMWNNFDIKKLATIEAWHTNRDNMIAFYNARRKDMHDKVPNDAHVIISKICSDPDINAIVATQNVDNLHEKAGLSEDKILHLHGNIMKNKSTFPGHAHLKYDSEGKDLEIGMKCEKGSQLRHDIVLFGDMLGNEYQKTIDAVREADILVIVGTSLVVEPVASIPTLVDKQKCLIYYIDPNPNEYFISNMKLDGLNINIIKENATKGLEQFFTIFIEKLK